MEIKDNGPGIDPNLGNQIFDDVGTTKGPGRGFGLALLTRLVSRINGSMQMVSSTEGATLEVNLPKN